MTYLNAKETGKGGLTLYVDRHFYMVRYEVIEALRVFSKQAQLEGHPHAAVATARLEYLINARDLYSIRQREYSIRQR